jgi:uncharacterized protein (TIGR02588 family)
VDQSEQQPVQEPAGADATASSRLQRAAQSAHAVPDIPLLEWVFAGIGFALVGATMGFIAWQGYTHDGAPPQMSFEVEVVAEVTNGYFVGVRAVNRGDKTAADVKVEGELKGPAGRIETSEMSFKYLPPRSERKGGLYFANDPRKFELTLSAKGYEAP